MQRNKKDLECIYTTKFPNQIQERVLRKLRQLDASSSLEDLKNPPGNNLEQLKGDRRGYLSIRVNQQWRLCFRWENNGADDVELVDYH